MSGVLRLNGATSGYIEIKAPAEANGATHTIPNTGFAAGKVLQVVQTVKSDTTSQALSGGDGSNGTSTWTDISGMTASITPAASTSKVLVQYNAWASTDSGPDNLFIRLLRGSTVINVGDTNGNRTEATSGHWQNTNYNLIQHTTNFLDTNPGGDGSTAITYKLQWADWYNNTVWLNRAHHSYDYSYHYSPNSTITLWEIGA